MHEEGYKFYLSENKIWLVDKVPVKYIRLLNEKTT
jgi:RNA:NAD 2'-phosphotransferase (TPT1/KptA family)